MRIRQGGYQGGYSQSPHTHDRADSFRKKHHVGQRLTGTLRRWVKGGLAWVRVDGQDLVAELHSQPELGATLYFLVDRLVPEIVLREVRPGDHYPLPEDPSFLLRYYFERREQLDTLLHRTLWHTAACRGEHNSLQAFSTFVASTPKALSLFTELQRGLQAINGILQRRNKGRVWYQPWRMPAGYGVELHEQEGAVTLGARLDDGGHSLIHIFPFPVSEKDESSPKRIACKVFTDSAFFQHATHAITGECKNAPVTLLGIFPLPEGRYDILRPLLVDSTRTGGGLTITA